MKYSCVNSILLIIILIIIIFVFLIIYQYYVCIKGYVNDILDRTKSFIPPIVSVDEYEISYPTYLPYFEMDDKGFNNQLAVFLAHTIQSAYHKSKKLDPGYPEYVEYIKRIGKNGHLIKINQTYVLSYRGTISTNDLLTDLDSVQISFLGINDAFRNSGLMTHRGFTEYWNDSIDEIKSLKSEIDNELIIVGHSLGCSSAAMTALSLGQYLYKQGIKIKLYMYAPPRIGNDAFMADLEYYVPDNWAIINSSDLITELPPVTLPTIGSNWLYDNWKHRIQFDIQLGSILLNHKMSTYICGLDNQYECHTSPRWQRQHIIVDRRIE